METDKFRYGFSLPMRNISQQYGVYSYVYAIQLIYKQEQVEKRKNISRHIYTAIFTRIRDT